ncbi:MAG TPA: DNA/RNA helicase domain-containing protein [Chitinophagaceae bacterium]|nr:DNA/RNA helicase domain-containing protein [Chitinophagaceae bacterium]
MKQAYYSSSVDSFLAMDDEKIIGRLNLAGRDFTSQWTIATTSWENSIQLIKNSLTTLSKEDSNVRNWHILLEYDIPRLGKRVDAVLLADELIFVIEYKLDRKSYELSDINQVEDYALDLSDFHLESRERIIIPILLAPLAKTIFQELENNKASLVQKCLKANTNNFSTILKDAHQYYHDDLRNQINPLKWEQSVYQPTPTIIQAAKALFAGQKVENITKYGAANLSKTSKCLIDVINHAREKDKKVVCFVTGVPGAGKTLVGLDIVHEKEVFGGDEFNTAYFSGNSPLINVLRAALANDHYERRIELFEKTKIGPRPKKKDSEREVKPKIQNLHLFIKDGIRKMTPPNERIVVFDEAQRCWDARHFSNKAKQNRNREKNPFEIEEKSEAELLFEFMNRHEGWAVIIALVGGGQEINTGEGGIAEWGKAIESKYKNWEIHISNQLLMGDSSTAGQQLFFSTPNNVNIIPNEYLHLSVSERSFKANNLNNWVNAVINNNANEALIVSKSIKETYPLCITRNINAAKEWLRIRKIGSKRIGLIVSSGGLRLKPYGIHARELIDETMWFLNDENDIRSSYYLEIAATEYKVQGLELDWVGVCWDADLRRNGKDWDFKNFSGTEWNKTNTHAEQQFLLNTYRVLLTRAREGVIIFVPAGNENDSTRLPEFYNPIFEYLKSCGMDEV